MTTLNYRDPGTGDFVEVPIGGGAGGGLTQADADAAYLRLDGGSVFGVTTISAQGATGIADIKVMGDEVALSSQGLASKGQVRLTGAQFNVLADITSLVNTDGSAYVPQRDNALVTKAYVDSKAGAAPPEVAVGPTKPTDPSVLLWVDTSAQGATP
jgi:hypothetical protein